MLYLLPVNFYGVLARFHEARDRHVAGAEVVSLNGNTQFSQLIDGKPKDLRFSETRSSSRISTAGQKSRDRCSARVSMNFGSMMRGALMLNDTLLTGIPFDDWPPHRRKGRSIDLAFYRLDRRRLPRAGPNLVWYNQIKRL